MRKFIINVNGNQYEVEVEEVTEGVVSTPRPAKASQPTPKVEKPAVKPASQPKPKEVKKEVVVSEGAEVVESPMPGTILSVDVKEGDIVKEGQILVILEAMKMENEIVSPRDGKITVIAVSKGASVNTGDELIVIE